MPSICFATSSIELRRAGTGDRDSTSIGAGQVLTLEIWVDVDTVIVGTSFFLSFDDAFFTVVDQRTDFPAAVIPFDFTGGVVGAANGNSVQDDPENQIPGVQLNGASSIAGGGTHTGVGKVASFQLQSKAGVQGTSTITIDATNVPFIRTTRYNFLDGTAREYDVRRNYQVRVDVITGLEDAHSTGAIRSFALHQNYPNPFNPETTIRYNLPAESPVTLRVYNMLGQEVTRLRQGRQPAGAYTVRWDGRDALGRFLPSGMYIYRLEAGGFTQARRMLLLK